MRDEPFEAAVTSHRDVVEVHLRGELDVLTVPQFRRALEEVWAGAERQVVIDLTELTFIDLRGVDALMDEYRTARALNFDVDVHHESEAIKRLAQLLHIEESGLLAGLFD